jgi:LysM repeat protein
MENVRPLRIVGFIAACIAILSLISLIFPKKGIFLYTETTKKDTTVVVDSIKLKFPSFRSFFTIDTTKYADIEGILAYHVDSNLLKELHSTQDSLDAFKKISMDNPARIHYPKNDKKVLHSFFEALENAEDEKGSFRIMHYGDSQIEMDRITSYIREQLQIKFGGSGPGFQPALQIIPNISTRQTTSGNFVRYASWGFDQSQKAEHGRYGPMLNFCELDNAGGTISFTPSHQAYSQAQLINNVKVLVGSLESDLTVTLRGDGVKYATKTAHAGGQVQMLEWNFDVFPNTITVSFSGGGTPEIYGIALDGKTGVSVDNLPMRGCSGTIFKRTNATMLANSYNLLNVKLLILEFGGNMMPSINGPKTAANYGKSFYEQIMYLKQQKPDMDIVVIGPADMSKRINGSMVSYPDLPVVVEELKKAAFDAGGAYWDTYQVMGGHNSMPTWVEQGLAGKDYIHFTTNGAKKISEMFYEALINDYNEYRLQKRIQQLNGQDPAEVKVETDTTTIKETTTTGAQPAQKGKGFKKLKKLTIQKEKPIIHIVKPGDTLWEISQKYGVPIENIMADNNMTKDFLDEGQQLKIIKPKK